MNSLAHYVHLIRLCTHAQLKAETHRSYLGYFWWILEPLLNTFLFYSLFFLFLGKRTQQYLEFLLVGTLLWQWIQSTLQLATTSILEKPHLLRQIKIPLSLFPITKTLANTTKFIIIYLILLVYLILQNFLPSPIWLLLVPLLLLHTLLIFSFALPLALLTPFAPDIKTILDALLRFLMLLSGIFFTVESIPAHLLPYFYANPFAHILETHRSILLHNQIPPPHHWINSALFILLLLPIGLALLRFADGRIPKILK
ncbi:MAG: ABC transporter permease [Methylacidiphilales bacterium]|nr:ABC transporter permease [Candidatus Methylacidiphilales bacterium]MDW8348890.1 ABC transporter permease [Verrucomicrobiae bacterium]